MKYSEKEAHSMISTAKAEAREILQTAKEDAYRSKSFGHKDHIKGA